MQLSSSLPFPTTPTHKARTAQRNTRGAIPTALGSQRKGMMGSEGSTSPAAAGACAVCGGAAAVYCPADAAALCGPCDAAVHAANPLASRHERVPLAAAVAAASGVYDDLFAADDVDAASSWPAPPPAQAQAQGRPHGSSSASFTTSDSGADGGGGSLFDLLSDVDLAAACVTGGHLPQPDGLAPVHHGAAPPFWAHPGLDAWMAAWPQAGAAAVVVPATAAVVAAAAEREARVQRYREKRKNRRFQKTIRYASRKAYAEARPRIKGRFVKRAPGAAATSSDDDATAAGSGAADAGDTAKFWLSFSDAARDDGVGFYVDAAAYGVVPSF